MDYSTIVCCGQISGIIKSANDLYSTYYLFHACFDSEVSYMVMLSRYIKGPTHRAPKA
jgi:hypothetical protein